MSTPLLAPDPASAGRRLSERYPTRRRTVCYVHLKAEKSFGPVEVRNLSRCGLSLALDRLIPAADVVAVSLYHKDHSAWSPLQLRGVYVIRHPREGVILGGSFSCELADAQLQAFLS